MKALQKDMQAGFQACVHLPTIKKDYQDFQKKKSPLLVTLVVILAWQHLSTPLSLNPVPPTKLPSFLLVGEVFVEFGGAVFEAGVADVRVLGAVLFWGEVLGGGREGDLVAKHQQEKSRK